MSYLSEYFESYKLIQRLELTAATVAVKIVAMIKLELAVPINAEIFWTDTQVYLS